MDIEKVEPNQIQDLLGKSFPRQSDSAGAVPDNDADVSLEVDYASFIDKAVQIPPAEAGAVQRARELLLSGELESSENIRAAAEDIVEFGP